MTTFLLTLISIISIGLLPYAPGWSLSLAIAGPFLGYMLDAGIYAFIPLWVALIFEAGHFLKGFEVNGRFRGATLVLLVVYGLLPSTPAGQIAQQLQNIRHMTCGAMIGMGQTPRVDCPETGGFEYNHSDIVD